MAESRQSDSLVDSPEEPGRAEERAVKSAGVLINQLKWVIGLRWVAGATVIAGGVLEEFWLHWYSPPFGIGWRIATVGVIILVYNVVFWLAAVDARPRQMNEGARHGMVWGQIMADLVCLTMLVLWTGGYASPLRGFFVFHMVFASLLLPRMMAFGVALVAIGLVEGMLIYKTSEGGNAAETIAGVRAAGVALGWAVTLLATVYLASRITQDLRRQRRRLARQNRRVRQMAARLQAQQQAMAQHEKMVAVGQMAAGVAHEIANPLASMDGLLQLLERRPEKLTGENLGRLRDQVGRINLIVRQLTTFARPGEAPGADGVLLPTNLNEVVERSLAVLRFDQRLKRVAIERELDPRLPEVQLSPTAMEQVIINLVINAADAMEATAAPRLVIATRSNEKSVELMVADNGEGIAPEVQGRIFEPFFTTKAVGKGTGLGLSISYSLVKKQGGEIAVESQPHEGARFTVRLPRVG